MAKFGRREALFGMGLVGLAAAWQVWGVRDPKLKFEPLKGAKDWSFAVAGDTSGVSGVDFATIGIEKGPEPLPTERLAEVLYRDDTDGVRVAVFSDFFCPFCRGLIRRLKLRSRPPKIALNWHELPILGPHSVIAARVTEAAALQGAYVGFYDQLIRDGFRPSDAWMRRVAENAGLDGAQFAADIDSDIVAKRLAESASAAATFSFFATPAVVIGRKGVLGALSDDQMEALIADGLLVA